MRLANDDIGVGRFGYRLTGTVASFASAASVGGPQGTIVGGLVGVLFALGEYAYDGAAYGLQQVNEGVNHFYNQVINASTGF